MATEQGYGDFHLFAIAEVMRSLVREAVLHIRRNRFHFDVYEKTGANGKPDVATTVDKSAQEIYIKTLSACFPGYQIIAEEDDARAKAARPEDFYFAIDPLDGTKAFIRRQSLGIGSMIALSLGDKVIAAYIGDVMTQEIYGFHDASPCVYRYSEDGDPEILSIREDYSLNSQYLLLDDPPEDCSLLAREMGKGVGRGGIFRKIQISSGGIGVSLARLWKGEVGGAILGPCDDTPWDFNPVLGISQKMGFMFIGIAHDTIQAVDVHSLPRTTHRPHELFILHSSRVREFMSWRSERRQQA